MRRFIGYGIALDIPRLHQPLDSSHAADAAHAAAFAPGPAPAADSHAVVICVE